MNTRPPPAVRVGCAGWSIPSRHAHLFGEGESHLARYATRFDVVEINSTFHRPHERRTFERWAASVPAGFRFSAKLPKWITHEARLQGSGDALTAFLGSVAGLGAKLGGVLVQLPPSLAFDARLADRFFAMLRRRCAVRIACEPRHASWFTDEADDLLARLRVARVAADPARCEGAGDPGGWRGLSYWRLHGSPVMYRSSYADRIAGYAAALRAEREAGHDTWCVFDNTASSAATKDALALRDALSA